jgi:hypothetical protein
MNAVRRDLRMDILRMDILRIDMAHLSPVVFDASEV